MDLKDLVERLSRGTRGLLSRLLVLAVVLVILVIGENIQPLRDLDTYLQEHESVRNVLIGVTILMAAAGALLLALSQFMPDIKLPSGMSRREAEAMSPPMKYNDARGRWARSFGGEASFANTKEAWRKRSWKYDRRWRILFSMMLGAILALLGTFGLFIVIGSPGIKFLMGLLLLYALGRTALAMQRA
jgi:hypothetical protein